METGVYVVIGAIVAGERDILGCGPRHWDEMSRGPESVYTTPTEAAVEERFGELATKWGLRYPAVVRL